MRSILIKSTNWIGDAVLQSPAIRALRRGFPEAHIALVARPWVAELFTSHPDVDEVIVEPVQRSERRALGRELRRRRTWDLGLALPNSFTAASLLWRAGAKRRRGYARDARRWLLTEPVRLDPSLLHVHEVDYYLHLLDGLVEPQPDLRSLHVPPDPEAVERVRGTMSQRRAALGMSEDAPLLAIGAAAAYGTAKRWLPERFAECAREIRERHGMLPVLIGSEAERETTSEIAEQIAPPVIDLAGEMGIADLNALLGQVALFLTNDSGPMHLAAAQGTPTVAVFGSTNWRTTAPLGPRVKIVREPTDCAPCMRRHCPIDHRCMTALSTRRVMMAVDQLIG
jgi:lipopolysaccharide heptosyltransferase II